MSATAKLKAKIFVTLAYLHLRNNNSQIILNTWLEVHDSHSFNFRYYTVAWENTTNNKNGIFGIEQRNPHFAALLQPVEKPELVRIAQYDIGSMTRWPQVAAWPSDPKSMLHIFGGYLKKVLVCIDTAEDQPVSTNPGSRSLMLHDLWNPAIFWGQALETYLLGDRVPHDPSPLQGSKKNQLMLPSSSVCFQWRRGTTSCRRQGEDKSRRSDLWRYSLTAREAPHDSCREPASVQWSESGGWQRPPGWYPWFHNGILRPQSWS